MTEYDGFREEKSCLVSEVWKVKKNGVVREQCTQDPNRGCVELAWL